MNVDPDYEKRRHNAYRVAQAVQSTFRYRCERAGIDRRDVPRAIAELLEREAAE